MAMPVASTSRAVLSKPCSLCQKRFAAGKTTGKTAQSTKGASYDVHKISPVAQSHAPAEPHASYPFVRNVVYTGAKRPPVQYTQNGHVDLGKSMYRFIRDRARDELGHAPPPRAQWTGWFSRNGDDKLPIGSILQVDSYNNSTRTSTNRFSGMLIGVKRAGGATTFTLRNVIHKTGVQMCFILGSPMIKDISIVLRAHKSKYKTDRAGNQLFPRWPRSKAWDIEKRPEAWSERTTLALKILTARAQAAGRGTSKKSEAAF